MESDSIALIQKMFTDENVEYDLTVFGDAENPLFPSI